MPDVASRLLTLARTRRGGQALALGASALAGLLWWFMPGIVAAAVPVSAALVATLAFTRVISTYTNHRLAHRTARWALGAFVVHLAIGMAISSDFRLTTYLGGDAVQYHLWAQGILRHWADGAPLPADLPVGKSGYPYAVAVIYWVFGPYQVAGLALNAFLSAALVPLMTDTTRRLYGDRAAWWVPPLVVMPIGFLLWSSQLLREAAIYFCVAAALNAAVRLGKRTHLGIVVVIALSVAVLFTLRNYMAVTLGGGLVAGIVMGRRGVGGIGAALGAMVVVVGLVVGLGVGSSGLRSVQEQADFSRLNNIRQGSATGAASGFLEEADISSGSRAAAYLPIALPRFFLGPFPWEIRPGRQMLAIPDVLTWWLLLPSLWRGFKRAWRRTQRGLFLMVLPTAGASAVLALLVANYGTVVRSRMQIFLLVIPIIALGLEQRGAQRREAAEQEAVGRPVAGGPVPSPA